MFFFAGLAFFYLLLWLLQLLGVEGLATYHAKGSYAAAIMFVVVGVMHFIKPGKIEAMIPPVFKKIARPLNYGSGLLEIVLGMALCFTAWQQQAAWALMVLLVLLFPANIYVAYKKPGWYNVSRLFFQPVYIGWIWLFVLHPGSV